MALVLSEPSLSEPVSLEQLKTHLRLDHTSEDDLLDSLIITARDYLEQRTGLALISQSWRLCLDNWPLDHFIYLHKTPVQTIDKIEQYDHNGLLTSVDISHIILDGQSRPARLYTQTQSPSEQMINGIEITFTAGFGQAIDVPDLLKRAILTHASHMYEFRGVVSPNMQPASVPQSYETLIGPWLRKAI